MVISLLAYVATFSGQLYFWRNYFLTLLHSHFFETKVTFSEQLFLQRCYFFEEIPSSEQSPLHSSHFFQNSYFFRAKHLPSSHFLRTGSSLGQVLFGTLTLLVEKLFRIQSFSEEVLFQTRYFCATFSEELFFGKSYFFGKARIRIAYFSWIATFFRVTTFFKKNLLSIAATFPKELLFQKSYSFLMKNTLP